MPVKQIVSICTVWGGCGEGEGDLPLFRSRSEACEERTRLFSYQKDSIRPELELADLRGVNHGPQQSWELWETSS